MSTKTQISTSNSHPPSSILHIFGIRHHGPGSARSLRRALEELQPDIILVEGPPDAADVLPLLAHPDMKPPVALLIYVPEAPQWACFYPFAVFSPEWQALHYGLTNTIPVRFMDLPQAHQLAFQRTEEQGQGTENGEQSTEEREQQTEQPDPEAADRAQGADDNLPSAPTSDPQPLTPDPQTPLPHPSEDPLGALAEAAGFSDGERWWDYMVEHRRDGTDLFTAILEAMTALRESVPPVDDPRESQREAYMRQTIRAAQKEGFQRIAVVCGAWHGPALATMPPEKEDKELLKGLAKVKTQATWVPWTYGRLSYRSGYGAGIESPGWYHHLWTTTEHVVIRWMTHVARLLRDAHLDASSAHVIEAVRLAEALAALRERPLPGLPELNEATQAVLCSGSDVPLRLVFEQLIVGETMGAVPDDTPTVPLQRDLEREQKRLKLKASAEQRTLDLDLRKPTDLDRSHLLHRLNLLGITWGKITQARGKKGTFHELWQLQWQPEFSIRLIEMGIWGNTIANAATVFACNAADKAPDLPALTDLIDQVLLADLPEAIRYVMQRLQNEAALASDVAHLMEALPPLANILRYGNVRKTDSAMVAQVVDGLVVRVCVGLPLACASLDDNAAAAMFKRIVKFDGAVSLLQDAEHLAHWQSIVQHMTDQPNVHGLVAGRCGRILFDAGVWTAAETARRMGLALSLANEPHQAAVWLEGFLTGSGEILVHDEKLLGVLDSWVLSLRSDTFAALLPLLRRTFATFEAPVRRRIGELLRRQATGDSKHLSEDGQVVPLDPERAAKVLPLVAQLLGLKVEEK